MQCELGPGYEYLRFQRPETEIYPELARILESIPIAALDESDYLRTEETVRMIGNVNEVLQCLREVLEDDYQEFLRDGVSWKGGFEYVVRIEEKTPYRLEIMTRLYGEHSEDTFHYGREIQRIEHSRFAIWVDD
jgi:hypothetical protein